MFIAEHEHSPFRWKIEYDAWKLLSVDARCRVLVAYFGRKMKAEFPDFAAIRSAVEVVCRDHPNKKVLLIAGRFNGQPRTFEDVRAIHETAVIP